MPRAATASLLPYEAAQLVWYRFRAKQVQAARLGQPDGQRPDEYIGCNVNCLRRPCKSRSAI